MRGGIRRKGFFPCHLPGVMRCRQRLDLLSAQMRDILVASLGLTDSLAGTQVQSWRRAAASQVFSQSNLLCKLSLAEKEADTHTGLGGDKESEGEKKTDVGTE